LTVDLREAYRAEHPDEIPEALRQSILVAKMDDLINWGRANSLWPMFFGLSCCFVETATAITSRHDISRFGAEVMRGSPRQSDVMVIAGTVFKKMVPAILRLYDQMTEPRWVISMGSCSNSGGMFDVYSVTQGVDTILPVDAYVQGCPPRPESLIEALMLLQKKIKATERPTRQVLRQAGGFSGTTKLPRIEGVTTTHDPRGPGLEGTHPRGTKLRPNSEIPAAYFPPWTPPSPVTPMTAGLEGVEAGLAERLGPLERDAGPVDWLTWRVTSEQLVPALDYLKHHAPVRFRRLEFATGLDNRPRGGGFRMVYHLAALEPGKPQVRLAVDLGADDPRTVTATPVYAAADWYEREAFDMFGIRFDGHPDLRRLFMPSCWRGHPLRKDHPYRGSEMAPFSREDALEFERAIAAHSRITPEPGTMVLNFGPHHPGTHGVLRLVLRLDGETVVDMDTDLGYHHRGQEKIAERQTYHRYLPYTDRIDYLAGVANNLPYVLAVEKLLGIEVPPRAQAIRVLMCELFRLSSHLVWVGTFAQDAGALTPVFFTFEDREQILDFVAKVTGARMHPNWFRIGGVAQDLPAGWREDMESFIKRFPGQMDQIEGLLTGNPIFVARTRDTGAISQDDAIDLGFTGPNLRATGLNWDLRKTAPYSGYEQYEFDVPTGTRGDNYDRYLVHIAEMRQSHRIIEQVVRNMPDGPWVHQDFRYGIPEQGRMLHDIESLIHHFVNVSRGFVPPAGEAYVSTEAPKGEYGFYVVSDGSNLPYRLYVRTASFSHVQALPKLCIGELVSDLVITVGAIDFVLGDLDK
jgi:NADH-quinone oxidoreductase subunit B/C/D